METLKDNDEPCEEYWDDYREENEPPPSSFTAKKLLNGISIKDLCDGKDVMFEINKGSNGNILENEEENEEEKEDEISEDISFCDLKSMREKRAAPFIKFSFREIESKMTNVTENGFVKKQVVTCGTGKVVSDHAYVTVHYNLYKENCEVPFDSTYLRNRAEKFRLDQGEAILGLEYAIKSMKKNENSMFFIKWEYAFGALGCPDRIGEKCDIMADITLLNFIEIDFEHDLTSFSESGISKIDFTKFINQAKQLLCNGSDEFSKGDPKKAIMSYRKALRILNNLRLADDEEERQMLKQKVKCLVNLAVCYNKLGKPEQACVACQEVLSIDCNSVKANFHYGKANLALSNFSTAQKYLLKADKLKPNDKDINREIKKLNDKKALYKIKDKIFWKKAFEAEEEGDNKKEEKPTPLDSFQTKLIASLEESIREKRPYVLPMPLLDEEIRLCDEVAAQMNMEFERHPHFCIFQKAQNNPQGEHKARKFPLVE